MEAHCKICGAGQWSPVYNGPIRMGKPGDLSSDHFTVYRCASCGVEWFAQVPHQSSEFYTSGDYREAIGESNRIRELEDRHDPEVTPFLHRYPVSNFRRKVVVDVGCGAGSYLDAIAGVASRTVGIEINEKLKEPLIAKGHHYYPSVQGFVQKEGPIADIAISHSVIEHVDEPLVFLKEIRSVLKPGGLAIVSTPNRGGFLVEHGPSEYKSFFYRKVHNWYFDSEALTNALRYAGFQDVRMDYQHGYSLGNSLLWLRDREAPGGKDLLNDTTMNQLWKDYMIRSGMAERLLAFAKVE